MKTIEDRFNDLQELSAAGEIGLEDVLKISGLQESYIGPADLEDIDEHVRGEILEDQLNEESEIEY